MQLFPHETIRPIQTQFMAEVKKALETKKDALIHAPTGIGKTAAALSPALEYAMPKGLRIFFLTSRHTQHRLVVDTARKIASRSGKKIFVADLIAKKHMCAQDSAETFGGKEFIEFCSRLRENGLCEFYENTRSGQKLTPRGQQVVSAIAGLPPQHTEELVRISRAEGACPYEIGGALAQQAHVVVCDYSLLFHPRMRASLLGRMQTELSKSIIIVDEAHNLTARLRDMMSERISTLALTRAIRESQSIDDDDLTELVQQFNSHLDDLSGSFDSERILQRDELMDAFDKPYDEVISELAAGAEIVRAKNQSSSLGALAEFLEAWKQEEESFVRIIAKQPWRGNPVMTVRMRSLDPGVWSGPVISDAHSTIMMSGTLTPTFMHRDLCAFPPDTAEVSYPSPFPSSNRLTVVVPHVSTQYKRRSPEEYSRMAQACAQICAATPGNVAIFFPSYALRDEIHRLCLPLLRKRAFLEMKDFTKDDKARFLDDFTAASPRAVLFGVAGGSFSEGIDIPGNVLKAVVVVGLPLDHPDLETKALIAYYDRKFGKGWDYGYLIPAFNKAIQSAGRCIRSETDKGAMIFMDERYGWPNHRKYFPPGWQLKISKNVGTEMREFFGT